MRTPIIPPPEETYNRVKRHMEDRPGDERMILLWTGFVAGLSEFGMLDHGETDRIFRDFLPPIGGDQLAEICLGTRAEQAEDQELIRKREEREEQERAQRLAEREAKKAATAKAGS